MIGKAIKKTCFQKKKKNFRNFKNHVHIHIIFLTFLKNFPKTLSNLKAEHKKHAFFHRLTTIPQIQTVYLCEHAINTCKTQFTPEDSPAKKSKKGIIAHK